MEIIFLADDVKNCTSCGLGLGGHSKPTGTHSEVLARLDKIDPRLAEIYWGGVCVLAHPHNPDRAAQAANSLRGVIEKLGELLGAPLKAPGSLKSKVQNLRKRWDNVRLVSSFDVRPDQVNDETSQAFLREVKEFFAWYDKSEPTRRQQVAVFLAKTDLLGRRLPDQIEKLLIDKWLELNSSLAKLAHHGPEDTEVTIESLLTNLNSLILDHLRPKVFEHQDTLDAIIAEGEAT